MHYKNGQTTIFILIGIIILFSIIAIYFFQEKQIPIEGVREVTEEIPTEMQPLKSFVQGCVKSTATDAVRMIGANGGYIGLNPGSYIYTGKTFNLDITGIRPTEFDALRMSDDWNIPYWWYLSSKNDCSGDCAFSSNMPFLRKAGGQNSIESQIEKYVNINLPSCLGGFASFSGRNMEIANTSGVRTTATIAKNDVIVFVEYPLEIRWGGGKSTVSQFSTNIDVNLQDMHSIAEELVKIEVENHFLDQHVLNIIGAYSGFDRNKLPPMAGSQMSFTPLFWSEGDVEKNLEEKLIVYVNMLQATNTENFDLEAIDFRNNPIRKGLYYNMVVPLQGAYYNYEVKFNYLGWPIYLNLGSGSIGPRESISLPLLSAIMPFQKYDIPYDVSYPVMVSIYDSQALEGSGYSFFFALESNVRNNEPVNTDTFQVKSLTQEPMGAVCEEKFKNSGNVSLFVTDKLNNLVDGAVILFSLGQETCYVGEANESGFFTGKFPKGALGSIIVNHPDFAAGYITPFMASNDPKDLGSIALNRYINKNITAKKMEIKKYVPAGLPGSLALWSLVPLRKTLTSKESVTIIFAKVAENPLEEPFVTAVQFNGDETKEIRIIPGNYTINVMLMQDPQTIIIPEDEVCWEDWKGDEECETIPAVTVANNDAYLGGTFEKQIIIGDEIYRNNKIELTALLFDLETADPKKHSDLEVWGRLPLQIATDANNDILFQPMYKLQG